MRKATSAVDALETLEFEKLVEIDGVVVEKIETKSRYISRRSV